MSDSGDSGREDDVVLLHSPTEGGDGIRVVRKRNDSIELGELRPMREGRPIHGEVVRLTQREESSLLFDCEVLVKPPPRDKPAEDASNDDAREAAPKAALPAADPPKPAPKEPTAIQHKGPPRVTTDAYRGGWDAIFGKRSGSNGAPN